MTVTSEIRVASHIADGTQTQWPFTFLVYAATQVKLYTAPPGGDFVQLQAPVTLQNFVTGKRGWRGGYFTAAVPEGYSVEVRREPPYTQTGMSLTRASGFDHIAVEEAFDLGAMRDIDLKARIADLQDYGWLETWLEDNIASFQLADAEAAVAAVAQPRHALDARDFLMFPSADAVPLVDSAPALRAALEALIAQGGGRLYIQAGRYKISSHVAVSGAVPIEIHGVGGMVQFVGSDALSASPEPRILSLSGLFHSTSVPVTASIAIGDRSCFLDNVTNISRGMLINIVSSAWWPYDGRDQWPKGEIFIVDRVDELTKEVTFQDTSSDRYTLPAETVRAHVIDPMTVDLRNIHFSFESPAQTQNALTITRADHVQLTNCGFEYIGTAGVSVSRSYRFRAKGIQARWIGRAFTEEDGALGYGILVLSTSDTIVEDLTSYAVRRAIDFNALTNGGPSRKFIVRNFKCHGGGLAWFAPEDATPDSLAFSPEGTTESHGVGGHGPYQNGVFENGLISECGETGITCRGLDTTIRNVIFEGQMESCILCSFGDGVTVQNCVARAMQGSSPILVNGANAPDCFILFGRSVSGRWKSEKASFITNNVFQGAKDSFIRLDNQLTIDKLVAVGNICIAATDTNFSFIAGRNGDCDITSGVIGPNYLLTQSPTGTLTYVEDTVTLGSAAGTYNVVERGQNIFEFTVQASAAKRIRRAAANMHERPFLLSIVCAGDSNLNWFGMVMPDGTATMISGTASVEFMAGNATGANGTDNRLTVGVTASEISFGNRRDGSRRLIVTAT